MWVLYVVFLSCFIFSSCSSNVSASSLCISSPFLCGCAEQKPLCSDYLSAVNNVRLIYKRLFDSCSFSQRNKKPGRVFSLKGGNAKQPEELSQVSAPNSELQRKDAADLALPVNISLKCQLCIMTFKVIIRFLFRLWSLKWIRGNVTLQTLSLPSLGV